MDEKEMKPKRRRLGRFARRDMLRVKETPIGASMPGKRGRGTKTLLRKK